MTDETTSSATRPSQFPPANFPTVFADGVQSLTNSPTIVKFFLARFEPAFVGDGSSQIQSFAQIIMPIDGFAAMFVFFEAQLRTIVQNGFITEERLAEMRNVFNQARPQT